MCALGVLAITASACYRSSDKVSASFLSHKDIGKKKEKKEKQIEKEIG